MIQAIRFLIQLGMLSFVILTVLLVWTAVGATIAHFIELIKNAKSWKE